MLINMTEYIVREKLDKLLTDFPEICQCEKCKDDMLAVILNQLPAQYVSTHKGELFKRIQASGMQNGVDIDIISLRAIQLVSASPQHETE
ncbi:MAG: competence protein ComFB [Ruminococcus sp.]|nr:competence protein ComFB [Ruminococcus sp.]